MPCTPHASRILIRGRIAIIALVLDREALFVDLTLWPPMAPTLPG